MPDAFDPKTGRGAPTPDDIFATTNDHSPGATCSGFETLISVDDTLRWGRWA